MFESLTERLNKAFKNIIGKGKLTDANMNETLKEVKKSLLDADVAYPVVKVFLKELKEEASGVVVAKELNPAQALIKIVNDKLISMMGETCSELNLKAQPPAVILMAGLQGSGKTTSSAKLAKFLNERQKKSVMMVSADTYRPAAFDQLKILAAQLGKEVTFFDFDQTRLTKPVAIVEAALKAAKEQHMDVLIVDTAGRLHIDDEMMHEVKALEQVLNPIETLFVVDGMTGQDAANTAKVFHDVLPLTGVIVTKLDGDARGGAILSIRQITGTPIKFIGMGEKIEALEPFHPQRMASRILGMGDILSLVEELERKVDKEEAARLEKKLQKGKGFDLEDFRKQLIQIQNMGGMMGLMTKLPGMGGMAKAVKDKAPDGMMDQTLIIINSMTLLERKKPLIINGSRKARIAKGSGKTLSDVNKVLKQYDMMQKMMSKMGQGGMANLMRGIQGKFPGQFG